MGLGFPPLCVFFGVLIITLGTYMSTGAMVAPTGALKDHSDVHRELHFLEELHDRDSSAHDVEDVHILMMHQHHSLQQDRDHDHGRKDDPDHQHAHMGQMDPSHFVFLMEKDLKVGKTMPIYFPKRSKSNTAASHFLSKEEADSIPFSSSQLPYLVQLFALHDGSPLAKAMEATLRHCELKPIKGETKLCATSLESMLDFVKGVFGTGTRFRVLLTNSYHGSEGSTTRPFLQNYTISKVSRDEYSSVHEMVACHRMAYPYAVFYCHHLDGESKIFEVSVVGEDGERVAAIVVCHMDTSTWNHDHVAFHMLGIERGTYPVCHFFQEGNLVWVPLPSAASI